MAVAGIAGAAAQASSAPQIPDRSEMGKDVFLKLLVTQLKNQNPLEPMQDREFIAQLAQMNSVEQLTNLNTQLTTFLQMQASSQAASLVGKNVVVKNEDGTSVSGVVSRVVFTGPNPQIEVNGKLYYLAQVSEISEPENPGSVE